MRAEALLLSVAVLTTGCASLPAAPVRREGLSYLPRGAEESALTQPPSERPRAPTSSPPAITGPEEPERLNRRRGSREIVTGVASGGVSGGQSTTLTRQAVLYAVDEVRDTTSGISNALTRLAARAERMKRYGIPMSFTSGRRR